MQVPADVESEESGGRASGPGDLPGQMRMLRMAQDMAAFGAATGETDWRFRDRTDQARFDYFAA
ncbi:MAG: hypothetical protein QOJ27_1244 [Sphingomonadales bacterium]|nr:hypothetical protein [Sphingomonadales bacterium]